MSHAVECKHLLRAVLGGLLAVASAAAQEPPTGCPELVKLRQALDSLEARDPTVDAKAAAERGDTRFWAVMRYAVVVPGISEVQRASLRAADYRVFEQTSDAQVLLSCESPTGLITDSTDLWWNRAALSYAERFNRALLLHGR